MIVLRSLIFNFVFYLNLVLFLMLGSPLFLAPRSWAMAGLKAWASTSLFLLRVICGTQMEVRGLEHVPKGAALVAGKHQSFWETFAILPLLDDPCMVLKRELTLIPMFGWFALKFRMIGVERSAGTAALRNLVARAKEEAAAGRQIVIMPEGTRKRPDDPPDYKPGAAALYGQLKVPCVPFGLNAGLFWPRRQFLRLPGTIVIEFHQAIPAGLPRAEFQRQLEAVIESSTAKLVTEARQKQN
jgi:1-acyl-sn-glycerol-3-phosphate acyltransferase